MNLSPRAYHKIIKISRTIADIEESDAIREEHIGEALQYRNLDRKFWETFSKENWGHERCTEYISHDFNCVNT